MDPFSQEPATVVTPRVVVLTGMLNAPTASIEGAGNGPESAKPVEALKLRTPTLRKNEPTRRLKTGNEAASNEAAGEWVRQAPREPNESYRVGVPRAESGGEAGRTKGATPSLEIISLEGTKRSPIEFAKNFRENPADKYLEIGFPCLIGFVPKISTDEGFVEWANPVTADSFRDHGHRLTSGSPSRLAIRAMLELARADNWNRVAVKGTVRLQAFAEATAAELDRLFPVSLGRGTADRSFHDIPRPSSGSQERSF
jgi:conjugative element/phage-associated large polyvalent protein